jgi:DNA-binding transcriptional MocR family regulator
MTDTLAAGNVTFNPLYKEVKNRITQGLAEGLWPPGTAIPSESRLAEQFRVSIGTVRKAIDELVAERILLPDAVLFLPYRRQRRQQGTAGNGTALVPARECG